MIRFAEDEDQTQLKALWQEAFGDSMRSIDFYFANRHQNKNMLVDTIEGRIRGMLTMLPVVLITGGTSNPGRYVYAVATDLQYRGLGISSQLLTECHAFMKNYGESAAVLVPSSGSLFSFYAKRGYETAFHVDSITLHRADLPPCPEEAVCTPCSVQEFFRLREAAFRDRSLFVRWDEEALDYVIKSARAFGDQVYYFRTKSGEGCGVCGWRGNRIFIRELALVQIDVPAAAAILDQVLGAQEYTIRLPADYPGCSKPQPFGMIHYLGKAPVLQGKSPYLALVLD